MASRCRCGGRKLNDGRCIYKCPPKPPKKVRQEGVKQRKEQMLSTTETRAAFKRVVPPRAQYKTNFGVLARRDG
jgi:hypothetical protein